MSINKYEFWLINDSPDFGLIKGGVFGITRLDAPIRLQRGDGWFGEAHIQLKHSIWIKKNGLFIPELVWNKCRQPGIIYSTEELHKGKIMLPLSPSSLMVLRYIPKGNFWTVVTLYPHEGVIDGLELGRYSDAFNIARNLVYTLAGTTYIPTPAIKKPRL